MVPRTYKSGATGVSASVYFWALGEGVTIPSPFLARTTNVNCIFVETHTDLPDSRAAAKAIEVIDKYLGLKVDYKPLIKKAEEFEERIRKIIEKSKKSAEIAKQKQLSYLG